MLSPTLSPVASLRRKPNSKYWIACFTSNSGLRTQRSTKTTNKKVAQKLADSYETAARAMMTEAQVRRVLSDLHKMHGGTAVSSVTVRSYFDQWIKAKSGSISPATKTAYESTARDFCEFLADRADVQMLYISKVEIAAFRDNIASTRTSSTANNRLKILRVAFQQAWRDGFIDDNPAAKVPILKINSEGASRRAFTLEELKKLIKVAEGDWKGTILFGLYTGQRLGDIVRLRWENIDLKTSTLALTTRKTHRRQILPLATPLRQWIEKRDRKTEKEYVFPALAEQVGPTGNVGALSNDFYDLMVSVKLVSPRSHQKKEGASGRNGRREQNELSFHSLRHTATSLMKNSGISPAIVQEFVGHDSKAISQHYTHIELAALQQAAESLPKLEL